MNIRLLPKPPRKPRLPTATPETAGLWMREMAARGWNVEVVFTAGAGWRCAIKATFDKSIPDIHLLMADSRIDRRLYWPTQELAFIAALKNIARSHKQWKTKHPGGLRGRLVNLRLVD